MGGDNVTLMNMSRTLERGLKCAGCAFACFCLLLVLLLKLLLVTFPNSVSQPSAKAGSVIANRRCQSLAPGLFLGRLPLS